MWKNKEMKRKIETEQKTEKTDSGWVLNENETLQFPINCYL
jgi:hypothetical protein